MRFWRHRFEGVIPTPCFRLPLHLKQVGLGKHRSGWPFVVEHLRKFHHPHGVLLDDFVERSFRTATDARGWREPWVGIFHHPPNLPDWLDSDARLQTLFSTRAFRSSLRYLKGAIALSDYLGDWLRTALPCPVLVLKHPGESAKSWFSIERWEQQSRRIVQVGWYARNVRAIFQVEVPAEFRKVILLDTGVGKVLEIRRPVLAPPRPAPK